MSLVAGRKHCARRYLFSSLWVVRGPRKPALKAFLQEQMMEASSGAAGQGVQPTGAEGILDAVAPEEPAQGSGVSMSHPEPHTCVSALQPDSLAAQADSQAQQGRSLPGDGEQAQVSCHSRQCNATSAPGKARPSGLRSASSKGFNFIKRVLLITMFHSTAAAAFMANGWETVRLRPLEVLRDGYDDVLSRMKREEFGALWIDVVDSRQFAGAERTNHVCNRLRVLMGWADRANTPIFLAATRRLAWQHEALKATDHRWCHFNVKLSAEVPASSVKHRIYSTVHLQASPCKCPPATEHVYDLDIKRDAGSAKRRGAAEQVVLTAIVATLEPGAVASGPPESVKPSDRMCSEQSFVCDQCGRPQITPTCDLCSSQNDFPVQTRPTDVMTGTSFTAPQGNACRVSGNSLYSVSAEPQSFPTEQKIAQRLRAQELKASGTVNAQPSRKQKMKPVEQHHDDCGEDLSSLGLVGTSYLHEPASDAESGSDEEALLSLIRPQLNASTTWSFVHSECNEPPELHPQAILAVDVDEMVSLLNEPQYASWGVELVELCGGEGLTSYLCVKRRLRTGHNFELTTGTNLCDKATQKVVLAYIRLAKPLVVLMGPRCDVFGPLGSRNRVLRSDSWQAAYVTAAELAEFCGVVAELQMREGRFFVNEQPFPSQLYRVSPWPQVRAMPACLAVVFHQCRVNQQIQGKLVKKPTELVSNSRPQSLPSSKVSAVLGITSMLLCWAATSEQPKGGATRCVSV